MNGSYCDVVKAKVVPSECVERIVSMSQVAVDRISNLGENSSKSVSEQNNSLQVVNKNKKRVHGKPIIGLRTDCESVKVKAVEGLKWIFISRLTTNCTNYDILDYLDKYCVTAEYFEIILKHASYKSFKIGVSPNLTSKLLDSNFWPTGTLIKEFIVNSRPAADIVATLTFLGKNKTVSKVHQDT